MTRIHSKIDQIDGHSDHYEDEKYAGSRHYWKNGWLGGAFQSFLDASEVNEECDIPDAVKKTEHATLRCKESCSWFKLFLLSSMGQVLNRTKSYN